jgi:hypothetical protein
MVTHAEPSMLTSWISRTYREPNSSGALIPEPQKPAAVARPIVPHRARPRVGRAVPMDQANDADAYEGKTPREEAVDHPLRNHRTPGMMRPWSDCCRPSRCLPLTAFGQDGHGHTSIRLSADHHVDPALAKATWAFLVLDHEVEWIVRQHLVKLFPP